MNGSLSWRSSLGTCGGSSAMTRRSLFSEAAISDKDCQVRLAISNLADASIRTTLARTQQHQYTDISHTSRQQEKEQQEPEFGSSNCARLHSLLHPNPDPTTATSTTEFGRQAQILQFFDPPRPTNLEHLEHTNKIRGRSQGAFSWLSLTKCIVLPC